MKFKTLQPKPSCFAQASLSSFLNCNFDKISRLFANFRSYIFPDSDNMAWCFHFNKAAFIGFTIKSSLYRHSALSKFCLHIKGVSTNNAMASIAQEVVCCESVKSESFLSGSISSVVLYRGGSSNLPLSILGQGTCPLCPIIKHRCCQYTQQQ